MLDIDRLSTDLAFLGEHLVLEPPSSNDAASGIFYVPHTERQRRAGGSVLACALCLQLRQLSQHLLRLRRLHLPEQRRRPLQVGAGGYNDSCVTGEAASLAGSLAKPPILSARGEGGKLSMEGAGGLDAHLEQPKSGSVLGVYLIGSLVPFRDVYTLAGFQYVAPRTILL